MSEARLKTFQGNGSSIQEPDEELKPIPLSPLNISGIIVKKRDLVEALRIYVPLIADIQAFEDGERFYLILDGHRDEAEQSDPA